MHRINKLSVYIYDGAHVSSNHHTISCQDTREKLGTLFTRTNHVTLQYVTDSWGVDNGFKLVITAFKDGSKHFPGFDSPIRMIYCGWRTFSFLMENLKFHFVTEHSCKDFRCAEKDFCINPDLLCDKINHCDDGSDESLGIVCEGEKWKLLNFLLNLIFYLFQLPNSASWRDVARPKIRMDCCDSNLHARGISVMLSCHLHMPNGSAKHQRKSSCSSSNIRIFALKPASWGEWIKTFKLLSPCSVRWVNEHTSRAQQSLKPPQKPRMNENSILFFHPLHASFSIQIISTFCCEKPSRWSFLIVESLEWHEQQQQ